jgi:hypothetical protein
MFAKAKPISWVDLNIPCPECGAEVWSESHGKSLNDVEEGDRCVCLTPECHVQGRVSYIKKPEIRITWKKEN